MSPLTRHLDEHTLLTDCHSQSIELLKRNLAPGGILAASPSSQASKRGYTAIFGRDAAVCAIGMALSGDKDLRDAAAAGLHTLAKHQARRSMAAGPGASALLSAAAKRGQRLGRHHAAVGLRALYECTVVFRQ